MGHESGWAADWIGMSAHRHRSDASALRRFAVCMAALLGLFAWYVPAVGAQEDGPRDFGDPPEVLVQTDPIPVAPISPPMTLDPVELLVMAAAAVIALGLATLLVTSGQRRDDRAAPANGSSNLEYLHATRAIHAAADVEHLCHVAAANARMLTGAEAVTITVDGHEATAGESFEVSTELVLRANRQVRLVSEHPIHAIPIQQADGEVVGLLVMKGGDVARLEAFEPLVEDGYASVTARQQTAALVFVDGLTGIANRRRFDIDLDCVVGHAANTHTPVAVAMFDVDHFKNFNDNNGHQAGDDVLRSVAELISANLRSTDVVYRYGGEEFVALLPGATTEDAYDVVERIRRIVERTAFEGDSCQPSGTVTLSVGVAARPESDGASLVRAADIALYEAKTSGRNRVVVESELV